MSLNPFNWLRRRIGRHPGMHEATGHFPIAETGVGTGLSSDQPIETSSADRFGRGPFAIRIADVLVNRQDASSIVLGIYGPWGDGKTSVLNMIAEHLAGREKVVCVRFNPWYFTTDERLIRGFFDQLARAIHGSGLATKKEALLQLLDSYSGLITLAGVAGAAAFGGTPVEAGEGVRQLASRSFAELDELRGRLDRILREAGIRIVVLIDDVDRLDRNEVYSVLRLVKLCADLPYTSYVLALDDAVVSAAIGERYGRGDAAAGRAFLEKIVQVPLTLPPAGRAMLGKMVLEGLDEVLAPLGIDLDETQQERVRRTLGRGLMPLVRTPRQVRRLVNSVSFAVPILHGEVNIPDLLALEAMRVVLPEMYRTIMNDPAAFIRVEKFLIASDDEWKTRSKSVVESLLNDVLPGYREGVREMLTELFPRLQVHWRNVSFSHESDDSWSDERRVCAARYFHRYFHYGVPPGDISDQEVARCFDQDPVVRAGAISEVFEKSTREGVWPVVIELIHRQSASAPLGTLEDVANSLAAASGQIPEEQGFMASLLSTRAMAQRTVARIVSRLPEARRVEVAKRLVGAPTPLAFAAEVMSWFRSGNGDNGERVISADQVGEVGKELVNRVRTSVDEITVNQDALPLLLNLIEEYGEAGESRSLAERLTLGSIDDLITYLSKYCGRAYGGNGASRLADFQQESYQIVSGFLNPQVVADRLLADIGQTVLSDDYHSFGLPDRERVARQFCILHRRGLAERT